MKMIVNSDFSLLSFNSKKKINSIKEFITGDNELTPYLSGPQIIKLFNDVGINDIYDMSSGGGMPKRQSRNEYTFNTMKEINGTKVLSCKCIIW